MLALVTQIHTHVMTKNKADSMFFYSDININIMPADGLATHVARPSAGMILFKLTAYTRSYKSINLLFF